MSVENIAGEQGSFQPQSGAPIPFDETTMPTGVSVPQGQTQTQAQTDAGPLGQFDFSPESLEGIFGAPQKQPGNDFTQPGGTSDVGDENSIEEPNSGMAKDPQQIIRNLQSAKDKSFNMVKDLQEQVKTLMEYKTFAENFANNEQIRKAVISKYHPEVFKPADPAVFIQEELKKAFPDYDPSTDTNDYPGSKKWLYNKKANELYDQAVKQSAEIPTLEKLEQDQQAAQQRQVAQRRADQAAIQQKYGWAPETFKQYDAFLQKVTYTGLASVFNFIMQNLSRTQQPLANNFSFQNGAPNTVKVQTNSQDDELFGPQQPAGMFF